MFRMRNTVTVVLEVRELRTQFTRYIFHCDVSIVSW